MKTTKKTKKIESVTVIISSQADNNILFENLLTSDRFKDSPYTNTSGKTTELKYVEDKGEYITGIVVTTKNSGLPPKRDYKNDVTSGLDFEDGVGLGYANVFIYDKSLKILMYEVNKNGTYLQEFIQYVYGICNRTEEFGAFQMSTPLVLRLDAYDQMLSMSYYQKIEFEIAQPTQLIIENDTISRATNVAKDLGGEYLKMEVGMKSRSIGGGLSAKAIQGVTNFLFSLPTGKGKAVPTLKVSGLVEDPENANGSFSRTMDLITEKYVADFKLDEPVNAKNIQAQERKSSIHQVYLRCKADFKRIVAIAESNET